MYWNIVYCHNLTVNTDNISPSNAIGRLSCVFFLLFKQNRLHWRVKRSGDLPWWNRRGQLGFIFLKIELFEVFQAGSNIYPLYPLG